MILGAGCICSRLYLWGAPRAGRAGGGARDATRNGRRQELRRQVRGACNGAKCLLVAFQKSAGPIWRKAHQANWRPPLAAACRPGHLARAPLSGAFAANHLGYYYSACECPMSMRLAVVVVCFRLQLNSYWLAAIEPRPITQPQTSATGATSSSCARAQGPGYPVASANPSAKPGPASHWRR